MLTKNTKINFCEESFRSIFKCTHNVNSYHQDRIDKIGQNLKVLAESEDGTIEAIKHTKHDILAIMWHPERDIILTMKIFTYLNHSFNLILKE